MLCPFSFLSVVGRLILQCKNLQENRFEGVSGVESHLGGLTLGHFAGLLQQREVPEMSAGRCKRDFPKDVFLFFLFPAHR